MALTKVLKIIITLGIISTILTIGIPVTLISINNYREIKLTFLYNAGIMIETRGMRIYIDPINLTASFSDLPADLILTTHNHGDHVEISTLNLLRKNSTEYFFPDYMESYLILYDGVGIDPEDVENIGSITVTAFYMYTFPDNGYPASHPREYNYTSYIVDINGFTIFHAGDSRNIQEYTQLNGLIDVALLPLGFGCQTMVGEEIIEALETINPKYFIPIHYGATACDNFISSFGSNITECQLIYLKNLESIVF